MTAILNLPIDEVFPDPNQPRRIFDQAAMGELRLAIERWGQMMPIWVRRDEHGKAIIVNGERRWRAIQKLREDNPDNVRYKTIRAFEADSNDLDTQNLRVIQMLVNSTACDLAPTEKALVIREIQSDPEGAKLTDAALQEQFGISKGQLRHARALAAAPEFIQAFGMPRTYTEKSEKDQSRTIHAPPLGMSLLVELVTLYNKLKTFDAKAFRESQGKHRPIAESETKRLGAAAQKDGWSKTQLQARCESAYNRHLTTKRANVLDHLGKVNSAIEKLHLAIDRAMAIDTSEESFAEMEQTLRALLQRIEEKRNGKEMIA